MELLKLGNPALLQRSTEITAEEFNTPELETIIAGMWQAMHADGGVGLAAPQVGIFKRIIVYGNEDTSDGSPFIPNSVLINPVLDVIDATMEDGWEGCLSVPGMRGLVPRYKAVKYSGFNEQGDLISGEVNGFYARLLQHEVDHLDGILYVKRIQNMRYFGFADQDLLAIL